MIRILLYILSCLQNQIHEAIAYYKENAKIIAQALDELGIWYTGGVNSPYIWLQCPNGMGRKQK